MYCYIPHVANKNQKTFATSGYGLETFNRLLHEKQSVPEMIEIS